MAEASKLGERLIQAGLITPEALSQALELQRRAGGRLGDCLVELRLISEQALLRFLASEFGTKYVSAEKLAKVKVQPEILDKVPVRMAEKTGLLPIAYDKDQRLLSVVMAEPQNGETIAELKVVAQADEVICFIALRSAINAAIKKFYYGDPSAFAVMAQTGAQAKQELGAISEYFDRPRDNQTRSVQPGDLPMDGNTNARAPSSSSISQLAAEGKPLTVSGGTQPTSVRRAMDAIQRASVMSDNDYVETLNVLVSLLEMQGPLKGHSSRVAKQARTVAQRMGLSQREVNYVTIAAYLHELGKTAGGHATLLSCAMSEEHKAVAKRYLRTPLKLFETVHLPAQVSTILAQLFEAFDGGGQPQGVKGEDIALGARIVAAVDSFEDLVGNPDNLLGSQVTKNDALRTLQTQSTKLFDPNVIEVIGQLCTGEILRQRLLAEGHQVLLAEPDDPVRSGLTRVLSQAGLLVTAVANSEVALHIASQGEADLVIASTTLQPDDAFVLTAELRSDPLTAGVPVLLLADSDDPSMLERATQLGVAGILLKPVDEEQLATQSKQLLDERIASGAPHRPVAGSLDELSLPDLLRIMATGRRSGQLVIRTDSDRAELYLEKGRLVHGVLGQYKGRDAVERILSINEGDFRLDPNFLVLEQQVDLDVSAVLRDFARSASRPDTAPHEVVAK
jgi:response regulator RpfG family c-di-GMP phosphodiesterase